MKKRTVSVVLLLGSAAWTQACGDDEGATIPGPDGGTEASPGADGGPSSTTDAETTPPIESGTDSATKDAGADADSGAPATTLDGGACDGGTLTVSSVTPQFGSTGTSTPITIRGTGFVSTPRVYVVTAGGAATAATSSGFVSSTSVTAIIPSGLPIGKYDVAVVNPGECAGSLAGGFAVVANPAPLVLSVSPAQGTTQNDVAITVTGCYFQANATLSMLNEAGATLAQPVTAAPAAGANDPRCNNQPLYTMTGTIQTKTQTMVVGAYAVRVSNPTDATFGDYSSFVISNPSGNLVGAWQAAPSLATGRRSLGVAAARIDDANRFLYAVGGEDAAGAALKSVEVAAVDRFGKLGSWSKQKNELSSARSGLTVVQRGLYLYAIGGTSSANGTRGAGATDPSGTPLASIERAKLLQPSGAPKLTAPAVTTGTGDLAKGAYYYRVAAVLDATDPSTQGETLPSEEIVAVLTAAGQVSLNWTASGVGTAAHYRIYRTAAANGASGEEVLIKDNVVGTTYTDTGADVPTTETAMALGSTGPWVNSAVLLGHARLNTSATLAPDPAGAAHLYVLGGWGQCGIAPAAAMNCYEYASISSDGATLGAFTDGPTTMGRGRMRFGADAMTAANGPANFSDAGSATGAFIVVAGGKGANAQANTTEYASVLVGGALGAWANPGGFSNERDGSRLIIANGYGYALFGGTAPMYSQTADQSASAVVTATTLSFPNWSNAGGNLGSKLGRHGVVAENAYFYVIGGTTNDTDALATVYQILH